MGKEPGKEAADKSVNPDRLLPGEDSTATEVEDTAHWIAVYAELVLFKERLVDQAHQGILQVTDDAARTEIATTDLIVLSAERDRLVRRLDFWKQRQKQLSSRD